MRGKDVIGSQNDLRKVAAEVNKAALPYKKYSLKPKFALANIYLVELRTAEAAASARAAAIRIAAALELLHIGVDHHYRNQGPAIKAYFETGAIHKTGSSLQGSQVDDIDLAIGDHFYASAIKEIASLGLINVIEASALALTQISSGYRTFDVLLSGGQQTLEGPRTNVSAKVRVVGQAFEKCGWLYYLAHQLACMPARSTPSFMMDKKIEKQLILRSGLWFRKGIGLELPDLEKDKLRL